MFIFCHIAYILYFFKDIRISFFPNLYDFPFFLRK